MKFRTLLFTSIILIYGFFSSETFSQNENVAQLEEYSINIVKNKIKDIEWLANQEIVIAAIVEQNNQHLSMQEIHLRDQQWQSSIEIDPFKKSLQEGESGVFIQSLVSNGKVFNEIFFTDNQGANVKAFPATSDYWQGDEDKWIIPFKTEKTYIGSIEFDQSSQERSVQVSIPIKKENKTIGVLIVGIKMSFVEYKLLKQYIK